MDESLELLYLGVGWREETNGLSLLHQSSRVYPHQDFSEYGGGPQIFTDIVGSDGVVVDESTRHLLQSAGEYLIEEE